jgi:hypothetical protein
MRAKVQVLQEPVSRNIVIGQLKGGSDQPIELRWKNNAVVASVKATLGGAIQTLTFVTGLVLGDFLTYSIEHDRGTVVITVNGIAKTVTFDSTWDASFVYFKVGNYLQDNSATVGNVGKVAVFELALA